MIKNFGHNVRQAREGKGLTQSQLAEALHVSTGTIKLVESGKSLLKLENFVLLCSVLEKSPNYFLKDDSPEALAGHMLEVIHNINSIEPRLLEELSQNLNRIDAIINPK